MKKMKKLVSVVMSVAMVYSLTGCSSGGKESAAPESKPAETQTPASGESSDGAQAAADSSNPIKIGFFSPLTSASASADGESTLNAASLQWLISMLRAGSWEEVWSWWIMMTLSTRTRRSA